MESSFDWRYANVCEEKFQFRLRQDNALQQQVIVPVSYGIEDIDTDASGALRTLCRALAARARVAIEQGDYDEALKCNADIYRLGRKCSANGLLIHWLIASPIKGIGMFGIYNMRNHLSTEQCLSTIRELAETEETPQLYKNMLHRERVWTEHTGGFYGHLTLILEDVAGDQRWAESLENIFCRDAAKSRLLQCELALQAYSQDHGNLPNQLSDVVPRYLNGVPVDPFDSKGQPVRYRRLEDGYLLYSVGPNRIDDHGAEPDPNSPRGLPETGELRLDVLFEPYEEETEEEAEASLDAEQ